MSLELTANNRITAALTGVSGASSHLLMNSARYTAYRAAAVAPYNKVVRPTANVWPKWPHLASRHGQFCSHLSAITNITARHRLDELLPDASARYKPRHENRLPGRSSPGKAPHVQIPVWKNITRRKHVLLLVRQDFCSNSNF